MHGVGAASLRRLDDAVDPQITLTRCTWSYRVGLVRVPDVERPSIALGIDGNGRDLHLAARPDYPHGNLAAVGYEDFAHWDDDFDS
jgi:hypothetical protein